MRYVALYIAGDITRRALDEIDGVTILDGSETQPLYLIEVTQDALDILKQLPDWTITPEVTYSVPDTQQRIAND